MADHCIFCDIRRPYGGTNILVLNNGEMWLEFCPTCGEKHIVRNEQGEPWLVRELFNKVATDGYTRNPMDVIKAETIMRAEDALPADAYYEMELEAAYKSLSEKALPADYWDNLEYRNSCGGRFQNPRPLLNDTLTGNGCL